MKLHGYCESCHKVKPVRVSSAGMMAMSMKRIPTGTCDVCVQAEEDKRRERLTRRRG